MFGGCAVPFGFPFDSAHGEPFDSAHGEPFDSAHGELIPTYRERFTTASRGRKPAKVSTRSERLGRAPEAMP